MEKEKWKLGKVQIIWSPGSKLMKALVIVLIVFSTAALGALLWVRSDVLRQTEEMRTEAEAVKHKNEVLEQRLEDTDSVQSMLVIAQEELGMVSGDSVIIQTQSSN